MRTKKPKAQSKKELEKQLEWATRIVHTQQGEIERLTKLNDKLTSIIDQLSKKDY